jgi:hypothetical protein
MAASKKTKKTSRNTLLLRIRKSIGENGATVGEIAHRYGFTFKEVELEVKNLISQGKIWQTKAGVLWSGPDPRRTADYEQQVSKIDYSFNQSFFVKQEIEHRYELGFIVEHLLTTRDGHVIIIFRRDRPQSSLLRKTHG